MTAGRDKTVNMYDIINTERKARKQHTCCLCGCPIEKGLQYIRQFQQEDLCTLKMHKDCFGLLSDFSEQEDYEEGVSSEDFINRVDDYVNDNHYQDDGWSGSVYERVKMIVKELEEEK